MNVEQERRPPSGPDGEEGGGQVQGDPVQVDPKQLAEPDVAKAHQGQRGQKMLTILTIGRPGFAVDGLPKRQGIDQDGTSPQELDIVGAGVDEAQAPGEGALLDLQRGQGGVLQLTEAPLVRVGNEGDLLGADDLIEIVGMARGGDLFVRDEEVRGDELFIKSRGHESIVMRPAGGADAAIEDAVAAEDVARRVPERGRQGAFRKRQRPSPSCRPDLREEGPDLLPEDLDREGDADEESDGDLEHIAPRARVDIPGGRHHGEAAAKHESGGEDAQRRDDVSWRCSSCPIVSLSGPSGARTRDPRRSPSGHAPASRRPRRCPRRGGIPA